jgi:hypothetical protein
VCSCARRRRAERASEQPLQLSCLLAWEEFVPAKLSTVVIFIENIK